jgi:hypothetical protein
MTTGQTTPEHLRSMDEVVADLTADLQRLALTDPRRLKLATWVQVLEDRIASHAEKAIVLAR